MRVLRFVILDLLPAMVVLVGLTCLSQGQAGQVVNDALVTIPFRHHIWQDVLTFAVNEQGEVDFGRLKAYPRRLNEYLEQLAAISPESNPKAFPQPNDKLAYWINAHNALALRLILDRYPMANLATVPSLETEARYKLGGQLYSLLQIREKLGQRAQQDPQLVFTLTDFTRGAPAVQKLAYEGVNLKALESRAMAQAMADTGVVRVSQVQSCAVLRLSAFFQSFERGLFAPTLADAEDREALPEKGFVPVSFTGWAYYIRPSASTHGQNAYCKAGVTFLPANQTLRDVRF